MEKKIIFLDIDGTLTKTGGKVSQLNIEAISLARRNGHQVYICTGRNLCSINPQIQSIGFDGIICSAGGHVEVNGKEIYSDYIPQNTMKKLIKTLDNYHIEYALETTNYTYMSKRMPEYFLGDITQKPLLEKQQRIDAIMQEFHAVSIENYKEEHVHKLCFCAMDEQSLKELEELYEKDFYVIIHHVGQTKAINGELIPRSTNKATGIQQILHHTNSSRENTIGVGDSMNDYQMIQYVQYGVAMLNGAQELKDISDKIARDVEDDAIYHLFLELGII